MDIKIKTLYKDRVKPTDLLSFTGDDVKDIKTKLMTIAEESIDKIIDERNTLVGIYISRE